MKLTRRGLFKLLGLGAGAVAGAKLGAAQPSEEPLEASYVKSIDQGHTWGPPNFYGYNQPIIDGWCTGPGGMLKHPGVDPHIYRYTEPIIVRSIDTPSRIHIIPGVTHEQVKAAVQEALEAMKNQRGLA